MAWCRSRGSIERRFGRLASHLRIGMRAKAFAGFLLAALILPACGSGGKGGESTSFQSPSQRSTEGSKATGLLDFQAPKLGGGTVNGSDFAGKDVAMWFWAPW
jgi:hypothetical protein